MSRVGMAGCRPPRPLPPPQGEGMPVHGRPFDKGNLYIHFSGEAARELCVERAAGRATVAMVTPCPCPLLPLCGTLLLLGLGRRSRLPASCSRPPNLPHQRPVPPSSRSTAVEFPNEVSPQQAAALKAAFGGPTPNGSAPMAEVRWLPAAAAGAAVSEGCGVEEAAACWRSQAQGS